MDALFKPSVMYSTVSVASFLLLIIKLRFRFYGKNEGSEP